LNMFLHELKAYRKTLIIWIVSIVGLILMYISFFPVFTQNIDVAKTLIVNIPDVAKIMLGIQLEVFKNINFFYSFVFSIVLIFAGIQALNLGLSIVSKEFRWKTVDFLFSRPVSRVQILNAKILSAFISILITNFFSVGVSILTTILIVRTDYNLSVILLISFSMFFIQLVFLSIGIMISVFFTRIKMVVLLSVGIVMGMFALNMLDKISGNASIWFLVPFRYFDLTKIAQTGVYEPISVIWSLLIITILVSLSYFFYRKKDIHAV